MILSTVQKSLLVDEVSKVYESWGDNQKGYSITHVIATTPKYKVETDGDVILFYDFEEDEIIPFTSVKDFEHFIFRQY